MKTVFLRVLGAQDKGPELLNLIKGGSPGHSRDWFSIDPATFRDIPGSPFAYWLGPSVMDVFRRPTWKTAITRAAKNGLGSLNDFRFVRGAMELPVSSVSADTGWCGFSKGGRRASFYQDVSLCIRWHGQGAEIKAYVQQVYAGGHWSRSVRSVDYYFRPGLTWPLRGIRFSAQAVPAGGIFSVGGKMLFADTSDLLLLLAFLNSAAFDLLVTVFAGKVGGVQYQSGLVESVPIAAPEDRHVRARLEVLAQRGWSLKRGLDTRIETSHAFVLPALLQMNGETLAARASAWRMHVRAVEAELLSIQTELDERCFNLYGIEEDDRRAITAGFGGDAGSSEIAGEDADGEELAEEEDSVADTATLAAELVSWAVGVAFGRFDVRLVTGERALPPEPAPFDPLPLCSRAMLTGDDGLPLMQPPTGYRVSFADAGILVDDPGHVRDLTAAARGVFEAALGSKGDAVGQEVAALLDPRDHDLRRWLASELFEHHLRRYSKSRRKAPILWQFGTLSGRYSVWCYAHRMTRDSLFAIQHDFVAPKLAHEERRLSSLVTQAGQTPSPRDRAEVAAQVAVVDELRVMLEEVQRVAPLWAPDFDDGIVLVLAPLWRLIPRQKAWQKELKTRWDELVAGRYDWAHLAMNLWPERVVPRCASDRSLAIAHSLEDVFWVKGADRKWTRRAIPSRPIDELIAERTSSAVKAALASLLDAPTPAGSAGRRGRNTGVTG